MPIVKHIEKCTRELGKPSDWETRNSENHCAILPIRDVRTPDGPFMVSAWELTPDELRSLQAGATLKLWIRGTAHPVVALTVGDIT